MKSLAVTGLVFVALMANSPVMPEATTVSPGQPCQTVGAFTGARHVTAPKRVLIGDRLVFSSPAFSFVVPKEWRLAKGADLERIEIFQSVKAQIQKAKDAMKVALGLDPAAPFELADTFWLFKLAKTFTVLTNSAGAYVSVDLTDNPTGTRYLPGCQLYELERAEFWAEFSRVTVEQASQPVTLAFRLLEVKEYRDSTALMLVYTQEDFMGSRIWTLVQFRSERSVVNFRHGATMANKTNGLKGLEVITQTFQFEK